MKINIKFSIITVTLNASKLLEKTIQSIVFQSIPLTSNIEYIIIDGKSTDGTLNIIKKYELYINQWISELDDGIYDAMNKGLKLATGDYVWFINAGDSIYSKRTIQKIVDKLDENHLPDIIYGETEIVNSEGFFLGPRHLKVPKMLTWRNFCMGMLVCHQSFLVKQSIVTLYNVQYRFASDYDWCIRCMKKSNFIYNSCLTLSCFLKFGVSTINRKKSLKERYRIMCNNYGIVFTLVCHFWFAIRFLYCKILIKNKYLFI
jgi:glycosyltransferase involved in cell wall biosynthesis